MRDEGFAGGESTDTATAPRGKSLWGIIGGLSGGALGFIVANVPGLVAGAVAGNRLGAVRDAKGKSVYEVFQELPQSDRAKVGISLVFFGMGFWGGLTCEVGVAVYSCYQTLRRGCWRTRLVKR